MKVGETASRAGKRIRATLPKAGKTSLWLLSVMLPVSLLMAVLQYLGVVAFISQRLAPFFSVFGLPAEAPLVFLTAALLNIYSAIAAMETLGLGLREITVLALMCLIAHNLVVESAVQRRAGSKVATIVTLRVACAFAAAVSLSAILPQPADEQGPGGEAGTDPVAAEAGAAPAGAAPAGTGAGAGSFSEFLSHAPTLLRDWAVSSLSTSATIVSIVVALMILQGLLTEFGVVARLTRFFGPLLRAFGLPENTHFLWIVANTLGLAYGSAIIIDEVESGRLARTDADLLNRHIALSHSLLEDTLLFVAIGVGAFWITVPRLLLAVLVVWATRLVRLLRRRRRSFC